MAKQPETMVVVAPDGTRGRAVVRSADPSAVLLRWEDGREETLPTAWLVARGDGWYAIDQAARTGMPAPGPAPGPAPASATATVPEADTGEGGTTVVPVLGEQLVVERRSEEQGRVRLTKEVSQHDEFVDEPVIHDVVQVERVPIGRPIEAMPQVRQEGDTTVVPVVEEQLVVEKRLILKEEVRITRQRVVERPEPRRVGLRQEHVRVERLRDDAGHSR